MWAGVGRMKCFQCIKEEYNQKIKWSQVEEAVTIINGQAFCFKHLLKEVDWEDKEVARE